jgi:hypothetical protein
LPKCADVDYWEDSRLTVGVFLAESERYAFDAEVLPGASCLNAGNPRLKIQTHPYPSDPYTLPITRRELEQVSLYCAEEVLQFLEGFLGTFFLQEMAAIETAPGDR